MALPGMRCFALFPLLFTAIFSQRSEFTDLQTFENTFPRQSSSPFDLTQPDRNFDRRGDLARSAADKASSFTDFASWARVNAQEKAMSAMNAASHARSKTAEARMARERAREMASRERRLRLLTLDRFGGADPFPSGADARSSILPSTGDTATIPDSALSEWARRRAGGDFGVSPAKMRTSGERFPAARPDRGSPKSDFRRVSSRGDPRQFRVPDRLLPREVGGAPPRSRRNRDFGRGSSTIGEMKDIAAIAERVARMATEKSARGRERPMRGMSSRRRDAAGFAGLADSGAGLFQNFRDSGRGAGGSPTLTLEEMISSAAKAAAQGVSRRDVMSFLSRNSGLADGSSRSRFGQERVERMRAAAARGSGSSQWSDIGNRFGNTNTFPDTTKLDSEWTRIGF